MSGKTLIVLAALSLLLLSGCEDQALAVADTNNVKIAVSLLFELDGVRLYRFTDGGRSIYYAVQGGAPTGTSWDVVRTHSTGKTTHTTVEHHAVPTVTRDIGTGKVKP